MTRHQDRRDQYRGIQTREVGAENMGMRGGNIHKALTFGEKELASGQECPGSEGVWAGVSWIRRGQGRRSLDPAMSERKGGASDAVRTHRT